MNYARNHLKYSDDKYRNIQFELLNTIMNLYKFDTL